MPQGKWSQREEIFQSELCNKVVNELWMKIFTPPISSKDQIIQRLQPLAGFLRHDLQRRDANANVSRIDEDLRKAIQDENLTTFKSLFEQLSSGSLIMIANGEMIPLNPTDQCPSIVHQDTDDLNEFMAERKISAVVTISTLSGTLSAESNNITSNTPLCIHSVGKVFTGILLMKMIREGIISEADLDKPIQLDENVLEQLSDDVRNRLQQATFRQIMTHHSGLGDYLTKQEMAIKQAQQQSISNSTVNSTRDLLAYADDKVGELGAYQYSNLGILLVGLSIEHHYNQHQQKNAASSVSAPSTISIDDLLTDFATKVVKMTCFASTPPTNARFHPDSKGPIFYGSPAGGYWTTANDMQKFAQWIQKTCHDDKTFERLIQTHCDEFYDKTNNFIAHSGDLPTDSAWFYCSLDKDQTSVCILSDQGSRTAKNLFNMLLIQTAWFQPALAAQQGEKKGKKAQETNRPPSPEHAFELHVQRSNSPPPTTPLDQSTATPTKGSVKAKK